MVTVDLKHCSLSLLRALAKECRNEKDINQILAFNEKEVYKIVAGNIYASQDTLRTLYNQYGEFVVWTLAENESTPRDVILEIVGSADSDLAKVLFNNAKLGADSVAFLVEKYKDEYKLVEKAIKHQNISAQTLIKIASWYPAFAKEILGTGKVKLVES